MINSNTTNTDTDIMSDPLNIIGMLTTKLANDLQKSKEENKSLDKNPLFINRKVLQATSTCVSTLNKEQFLSKFTALDYEFESYLNILEEPVSRLTDFRLWTSTKERPSITSR